MTNPVDHHTARTIDAAIGRTTTRTVRSRRLTTIAMRRMHDAIPGYPTMRTGGNPPGDDTPDTWMTNDTALVDIAKAKDLARRLDEMSTELLDLFEKWGTTKIGSRLDANPRDVGCTSCNRANHFSPRRPEGGDVCRWCADTLRAVNVVRSEHGLGALVELPLAAVQKHARGQRVTVNDIDQWADVSARRRPVRLANR